MEQCAHSFVVIIPMNSLLFRQILITFFSTDTSSLGPKDTRNRYGVFPNKIQNNMFVGTNPAGNNQSINLAETPLVR